MWGILGHGMWLIYHIGAILGRGIWLIAHIPYWGYTRTWCMAHIPYWGYPVVYGPGFLCSGASRPGRQPGTHEPKPWHPRRPVRKPRLLASLPKKGLPGDAGCRHGNWTYVLYMYRLVYICIHIHIYIHICIYLCMYIYIWMYICIRLYIHTWGIRLAFSFAVEGFGHSSQTTR